MLQLYISTMYAVCRIEFVFFFFYKLFILSIITTPQIFCRFRSVFVLGIRTVFAVKFNMFNKSPQQDRLLANFIRISKILPVGLNSLHE